MQDPIHILILVAAAMICGSLGFLAATLIACRRVREAGDSAAREAWQWSQTYHRALRDQEARDSQPTSPRTR